ncbi:MAG: LacI family transcriptional regulator [Acidobacteria bacterium]|nr:LacI family transcriptional regulator [Acidobacteriota bacterium]
MPVSIKDVAARCGVSTATVSHVLNRTRRISPATQKKVLAAVEELGYSINRAARNLAMGRRSCLLGVLISDIRNPFFPEVVSAFRERALLGQLEALVLNTDYDPARMADCVRRLLGLQIAGACILTSQTDPSGVTALIGAKVPAVYLDVAEAGPYISNISVDCEEGITEGLDHLRGLGHKRIGYIGGPVHLVSAQRRKRSFIDIAARRNLNPVAAVDTDFSVKGGYNVARYVLETHRPSALLAGNDLLAIGALHAAYDLGLEVPRDLSLAGFDEIEFAKHTRPSLTSVALPRAEIGRLAFDELDHMMKSSGDPSGVQLRIRTQLIVRQSTAAPSPRKES